MTAQRRRNTIYGNDLYCEIAPPGARQPFKVTHWDLWIALVLDIHFGGNWDELIDHLRAKRKEHYHRDEVEGLLNHVRLLRQALDREGLTVGDILAGADPAFLKTQIRKARRKILDMGFRHGEKSPWMIDTPRKQREERAMRGRCAAIGVTFRCPPTSTPACWNANTRPPVTTARSSPLAWKKSYPGSSKSTSGMHR